MTLTEYAKEHGISRPTLYTKIKNAGIDLQAIRNSSTKELTPEGIVKLNEILGGVKLTVKPTSEKANDSEYLETIARLERELNELKESKRFLEGELAIAHQNQTTLQASLQTALQTSFNIAKLTAGDTTAGRKLTLMERLTGHIREPKSKKEQ